MISSLLAQRTFWLEPPASVSAQNHDLVFYALLYVMAFFFFLVVAIMLTLVVVYRRRKGQEPVAGPTHNTPLEICWTVIPLAIVIGFFVLGLHYYVDLETPPAGAEVVDVEASQWQFNFKYANGAESNELYLLMGRPVVLRLTSKDVTHALYIPAFRVQRNAVPGQNTEIWFQPTLVNDKDPVTGEVEFYHVFCTQYCGNGHAEMNTRAYVLDQGGLRQEVGRGGKHLRRQKQQTAAALRRSGQEALCQHGLFPVPLDQRGRGDRPDLAGAVQEQRGLLEDLQARIHARRERRRQDVG